MSVLVAPVRSPRQIMLAADHQTYLGLASECHLFWSEILDRLSFIYIIVISVILFVILASGFVRISFNGS
jgi:hypothetical protein